jgi:hypothetical protein
VNKIKSSVEVLDSGQRKDGSVVQERIQFLIGKRCLVRVWWTAEGQVGSPGGDLFTATLVDCVPIGRDYYFVLATDDATPKRCIIKTAAVLQIIEV